MRAAEDGMIRDSKATWDKHKFKYELLNQDELRYRYPQFRVDTARIGLYEPDAGVARSRRATQAVAESFEKSGGTVLTSKAAPGTADGRRLTNVALDPGTPLKADIFVFAVGPWMGKVFPDLMAQRTRMPMGHVFYFATPPGDNRFMYPNCPSWNVPGTTGWPTLSVDNRGFRVRAGGRPSQDPDTSVRWVDGRYHESARNFLTQWFPDLLKQPLLETRSCHYESSSSRNFVVDKHPDFDNVWLAGLGNAEGFKMGPVVGEYVARRVLGKATDPSLDKLFKIPENTYGDVTPGDTFRARRMGRTEVEELL
jgi:glycine/D-amino acid oxidase-like deaminating enzyme